MLKKRLRFESRRAVPEDPCIKVRRLPEGVPLLIYLFRIVLLDTSITMSDEARFKKAVQIVNNLPKEGPIRPTQDEQLLVSTPLTRSSTSKC